MSAASELEPFVSIVVPIYNRREFLKLCLPHLFQQTYPLSRYEIILVDDGSTDGTVKEAQSLAKDWTGQFQIIQQSNQGPASARNAGLRVSTADIVAFIDSDCVADRDWLKALLEALVGDHAVGAGSPLVTGTPEKWISCYLQSAGMYRHRVRKGEVDYLVTGSVAFYRDALIAVGGFQSTEGTWVEDVDLSYRLKQEGYKLTTTTQGKVHHYGDPPTIYNLARILYRYGYGNASLSKAWRGKRNSWYEILRHCGAVCLAPYLALRYTRRTTSLLWIFPFTLYIVVEHTAFVLGMLEGIRRR